MPPARAPQLRGPLCTPRQGAELLPAAGSGAAPRITLIVDVLYYLSMRQPLNADRPQAASSLLLEAVRRNGLGTVTGPGGTSVEWVDAFQAGRDPAWVQRVSNAIARLEVGGLLPPVSDARLVAVTGTPAVAGISLRAAYLKGDEVQFGYLPGSLLMPATLVTQFIRSFRDMAPQLGPDEDCAVEVGEAASVLFYCLLATGIAQAINVIASMGTLSLVGGINAFITPLFPTPPATSFRSLSSYRTSLPLRTIGLCQQPFQHGMSTDYHETIRWPLA